MVFVQNLPYALSFVFTGKKPSSYPTAGPAIQSMNDLEMIRYSRSHPLQQRGSVGQKHQAFKQL